MSVHFDWLKRNRMVCNIAKTEAVLFVSSGEVVLQHNTMAIKSQPFMKVLGIIFDKELL
jgi:hypothetical protein